MNRMAAEEKQNPGRLFLCISHPVHHPVIGIFECQY